MAAFGLIEEVARWHRGAMQAAEDADAARIRGDHQLYHELLVRALDDEVRAADLLEHVPLEPSRSILYSSAAAIALELGNHAQARRCVAAIVNSPRPDILSHELAGRMKRELDAALQPGTEPERRK